MNVRRLITPAVAIAFVAGCLAASACSTQHGAAGATSPLHSPHATHTSPLPTHTTGALALQAVGTGPGSVLGVVTTNVARFDMATGVHANLEVRYISWGTRLPVQILARMESAGILPLIELEPTSVSLRAVADGQQDAYIRELADEAKSLHGRLSVSFGPEMNGNWYSWGSNPSLFTRAWRHLVRVFRAAKATDVSWVWIVHHVERGAVPLLPLYWPGSAWVTWVGIDGYYEHPYDSFHYLFAGSLAEIRKFTADPVLITETAVGPLAGNVPAKINNLLDSVKASRLLGLVWFDIKQNDPPVHQNWNLESRLAALAAFRAAAMRAFSKLAR